MWEPETLDHWLRWAASLAFLFRVIDGDKLVGLAIARPVSRPEEITRPDDKYEIGGDTIYVDLAISTSKPVLRALCSGLWQRFGDKPKLAFHRFGRSLCVKEYDFMKFRKSLIGG